MRISSALSRLLLVGCIISVVAPFSVGQGERPQRGQGGGGPGGGGPGGGRGGFGGGGGIASLLTIKEVREELKMDEEQVKEMDAFTKELRDEMQTQFAGLGGGRGGPGGGGGTGGAAPDMTKIREAMASMQLKSESKLGDVLDPVQMDRLVGLFIQRDGVRTLSSKTISTRLGITEEQKAKIAEQEKVAGEEMRSLFGGGGGGGAGGGDMREKMDKMRKDSEEKITGVLTAAQKAKMEELKGAKFEFPAQPARGGPGGGRGGNPQ